MADITDPVFDRIRAIADRKRSQPNGIADPLSMLKRAAGIGSFSGSSAADPMNPRYRTPTPNVPKDVDWDAVLRKPTNSGIQVGGDRAREIQGLDKGINSPITPPAPVNGGGSGPKVDPTAAVSQMYNEMLARATAMGQGIDPQFDDSIAAVKGNYAAADSDVFKQYMAARDDLTGRAGNLGVDYDESKMGQDWDVNLRRMQEMSNSNLDSDLSYFEKMRGLKTSAVEALLMTIEQDKQDKMREAIDAMRASYSGSGGGGSSASAGKATETQTIENVGDVAAYQELVRTKGASVADKIFFNNYLEAGRDPAAAMKLVAAQKTQAAKLTGLLKKVLPFGAGNKLDKKSQDNYAAALAALDSFSGSMGNPKITQKITL